MWVACRICTIRDIDSKIIYKSADSVAFRWTNHQKFVLPCQPAADSSFPIVNLDFTKHARSRPASKV